ncbi:MAG TPA: class I SAM-dependent methyltransferase [Terriglobia bacterium]|nr:class I SAM-dependent methyltransferase [Terriglobia bacterium]
MVNIVNAATNTDWGSSSRLSAAEKFKAKSAAMGRDVTEALVDYAAPRPGMKILDLASGTGEPAITLAARIGASSHVTALDLSADLLAIAADRARQRGLQNITTQQGDAQRLPFGDNQFDLATSRFGVMFFADVDRALRELHRVLKPGARACFVVWGPPEQPYFSTSYGTVHRHIGGPLLTPDGINPFRFARPGSLSEAFLKNGFTKVDEETRTVPWTWPGTAEEVWELEQAVGAAFQPMLKRVPAEKWPEIHGEVLAAIRKYEDQGSIKFGATVVLASGVKP